MTDALIRFFLAVAHACGWHPEKQFAQFLMRRQQRIVTWWRDRKPPRIEQGFGVRWTRLKNGWAASWHANPDLVKQGYLPKRVPLWRGPTRDISPAAAAYICDTAIVLQTEMHEWLRKAA